MKCSRVFPLFSVLLLGCASTGMDPSDAAPSASAKASSDEELAEVERKLAIAVERLQVAELELAAFELEHENAMHHARAAVQMAEANLAKFREADAPSRVASEELDLQTARDRAQEAKDELAQIEIMYEDQDLDDLTAEFVVSRGRRAAERAEARIAIQEARFQMFKERELPQEEQGLELALDKARFALKKAEMEGEINRQKKSIALQEARNSLEELRLEKKELEEGAKS